MLHVTRARRSCYRFGALWSGFRDSDIVFSRAVQDSLLPPVTKIRPAARHVHPKVDPQCLAPQRHKEGVHSEGLYFVTGAHSTL